MHENTIKEFIQKELIRDKGRAELSMTENLLESNVIDSLGIMKLVPFLENTFKVKIGDDEILPEYFETIQVISAFVERKIQ